MSEFQEYPKWIELPESTPGKPVGVVVSNAEEEKKLLDKLTAPKREPTSGTPEPESKETAPGFLGRFRK